MPSFISWNLATVVFCSITSPLPVLSTRLGVCNFIDEHHNIIILGATGSGKTYLANAFGMAASRGFHTVRYIRLPEQLAELAVARAKGTYRKIMRQCRMLKLLILDEWLLYPLKETEAHDLLELTEDRYKKASTIFCSQFDVGGWHTKIGASTLADTICDRIVHDSYTIASAARIPCASAKGWPKKHRKGLCPMKRPAAA